jgi:YHS domain-containing protein
MGWMTPKLIQPISRHKKRLKMKKSFNIIWIALVSMAFVSCNNSEGKKNVVQESVQQEIVKTEKLGANYQVGDHVPNELVCMVNNAYMGKPQMPVPVDGKTYYGCCEMCVGKLNQEESARMSIDPFSGKQVDKSEAYIVLSREDGRVAYFESEANYKASGKK